GEPAALAVGPVVDPLELARPHLGPRPLRELAPPRRFRRLRLLDEAAREVPVAPTRLDAPTCQQHLPVAHEHALDRRQRIRPVALAADRAADVVLLGLERASAARAIPPPIEEPHRIHTREREAARPSAPFGGR